MHSHFIEGFRYHLTYEEGEYQYCEPTQSGFTICDCWIVNEHGEVDPGRSQSPVPIRISDCEKPVRIDRDS